MSTSLFDVIKDQFCYVTVEAAEIKIYGSYDNSFTRKILIAQVITDGYELL